MQIKIPKSLGKRILYINNKVCGYSAILILYTLYMSHKVYGY